MSTLPWLRWHTGTVTDPKWRVVATRADTSVSNVISVWACILEAASEAENRGSVESWCADDVAANLGIDSIIVERIWGAMQGKVLDGQQLTGWNKRQPLREREDYSTERVRRHRASKDDVGVTSPETPVTPRNTQKRQETPRVEESRVEEIKATTSAVGGSEDKPPRAPKSLTADEEIVLAFYLATHPRRKIDDSTAKRYIGKALKQFSAEDLKQAIRGNAQDEWHAERRKHELSYILRNTELISSFIEKSRPEELEVDADGDPVLASLIRMVK